MKLIYPAMMLLLTTTALCGASQTQAAATGTINVTALITSPTCQIDINGNTNAVVTLPDAGSAGFKKAGDTAGRTAITINVTQCGDIAAEALEVALSKNVATTGWVIPATGTAKNVAFAIAKNNVFVNFNSPAGTQNYPVTITGGKGSVKGLELFYYATAVPVQPGRLTAGLTATIKYK